MNLPNKITMARLAFIPAFIIALYALGIHSPIPAILFAIASLTDFVDGRIARSRHMVTTFGKFMDPLVDKVLTLSAFIMLVAFGRIPAWVVIIIVARELLITGFRTIAASNGITIAASLWGKYKTTCQMITILFFLMTPVFGWNDTGMVQILDTILLGLTVFFTLLSGIDYLLKNITVLDLKNI